MVFATNALSSQFFSNFQMSCGSVSIIPSSIYRDPFIEDNHIIGISVAAKRDRTTGVNPVQGLVYRPPGSKKNNRGDH